MACHEYGYILLLIFAIRFNLTTDPIPVLIRRLAVLASVGMFFNTMYNVVDTFYAGRMSTDALAALSLTFPIFFTLLAMGMSFPTGTTVPIGNALGRGKRGEAASTRRATPTPTMITWSWRRWPT